MKKVRADEVAHWLREAREEQMPPTDSKPVPAAQQHPQRTDQRPHLGDEDDGSPD